MILRKNAVAIITARGGSKRIPKKNIRSFLGQPIIQYSIDAALQSGCFDLVMVSTDSEEIAMISRASGAFIPFLRSAKSSDDQSTTAEVLEEVLCELHKTDQLFEYFCCIYPTAPFVNKDKLREAYFQLKNSTADGIIPVCRFSYPILRSLKIENGLAKMNWPENLNSRSQDLPPAYHDCGQFYFFRTDRFLTTRSLFTEHTLALEVPESEVQDIDTEEDWKIAEVKYSLLLKKRP